MIVGYLIGQRLRQRAADEYMRRSLERRLANLKVTDGKPDDDGNDEDHEPDEPHPNGV